jgi:hypothetical protein
MDQSAILKLEILLQHVQRGDKAPEERLVSLLRPGVAFLPSRSIPQKKVGELTHKALSHALEAAIAGSARSAQELIEITLAAVHEMCGEQVPLLASDNPTPVAVITKIASFPRRQREVLSRYYALGESREEICTKMGLSLEDFQSIKDEAKTVCS